MVSIIFRIRNQAIYISISHVYGMKKGSLYLSIYLELLVIYVLAVVSSTALAYGLFRVINNLFGPAFRISLIPTSLNLFTSFMFMVFMGVIIVSFYATIAIIMIKRYKPIAILRMSNRF
jgi:ABC-type antimicrobial peptide transport system permease subunit